MEILSMNTSYSTCFVEYRIHARTWILLCDLFILAFTFQKKKIILSQHMHCMKSYEINVVASLTVPPQVSSKFICRLVEQRSHTLIQRVHVFHQPFICFVVHLHQGRAAVIIRSRRFYWLTFPYFWAHCEYFWSYGNFGLIHRRG